MKKHVVLEYSKEDVVQKINEVISDYNDLNVYNLAYLTDDTISDEIIEEFVSTQKRIIESFFSDGYDLSDVYELFLEINHPQLILEMK